MPALRGNLSEMLKASSKRYVLISVTYWLMLASRQWSFILPANASLYLPDDQVDLTLVFDNAARKTSFFKRQTYYKVPIGGEVVRFNIMEETLVSSHMQGLFGYINSLSYPENIKQDLIGELSKTKLVLGLKTETEFVQNKAIFDSLFDIAEYFKGYIFMLDSVISPDGETVVGPSD